MEWIEIKEDFDEIHIFNDKRWTFGPFSL